MDALCMKAGIHGMAGGNVEIRAAEKSCTRKNLGWGFTFRHPLTSLWPAASNTRYQPAIAVVDDAVLADEIKQIDVEQNGSWILNKTLHNDSSQKAIQECEEDEECDVCAVDDDDDDERIEFNRESFSKLLQKVSLAEARLYAHLSYLGCLAYSIPQIKTGNLLQSHKLKFVTSSLEKKDEALKAEKQKLSAEDHQKQVNPQGAEAKSEGNRVTAYRIAASAASYVHSHTKTILHFNSAKSMPNENEDIAKIDMMDEDVASLMATDSVAAVVAAKEEVKQAVADDLNSTLSSPCEWFICDDDQTATRFFVIQGSESLASWQANLLFEPIKFEGMDVPVHRGIYEAAKGMYQQMLPEIQAHIKLHGDRAKFRFTGHSLGGSLSVLINLMLLIRGEAPRSSLLPVITYGAPSIMCGGDRLLQKLGLPRNHVRSITMHRDIVPRAFSCNYPNRVAELLKAVNGNFRNHPCLNKQKLLYTPMGELLILQPDDKFSPSHDLLPPGSGLYLLTGPASDVARAEKHIRAAQAIFLNSPHPLEILSDRSAYGSEGNIQRDHDMGSYLKSVRSFIRQELNRVRKAKRDYSRKVWWPLVGPSSGVVVSRPVVMSSHYNFSGIVRTGRESLKRFSTLVASQHMHLLVVVLGTCSFADFH